MSRKDSKSIFSNIMDTEVPANTEPADPSLRPRPHSSSPHLRKVAAGVRHLQEQSALAERLLKQGEGIVELDVEVIDPSPIPDRFTDAYHTAETLELTESIRQRGQVVPGIVRPKGERFEIVSGRRRLAVARDLGLKFRAIIRSLSDTDAIILQGEENSNRKDLTFIERCMFGARLESAGYTRDIISTALSTSPSHLSEMLKITFTLPRDLIEKIGPSPDIGRRRWLDLVQIWTKASQPSILALNALDRLPGNIVGSDRFHAVFQALLDGRTSSASNSVRGKVDTDAITSKGMVLGSVSYGTKGARLSFDRNVSKDFIRHVVGRIEALHDEYLASRTGSNPDKED